MRVKAGETLGTLLHLTGGLAAVIVSVTDTIVSVSHSLDQCGQLDPNSNCGSVTGGQKLG